MIVVEDNEVGEIQRFLVADAHIEMGSVQIGKEKREFNPERVFSYFRLVENQLFDFANKYPSAFRYIPRKAYGYLTRPPILSELYKNVLESGEHNWLIDLFFANPLLKIVDKPLPKQQQIRNTEYVYRIAMEPPYSPRFYYNQEMSFGLRNPPGWSCRIDVDELEKVINGPNRSYLLDYIRGNLPIFVTLDRPEEMDKLLKWIIFIKDAGLKFPNLILSVKDHKPWEEDILRLFDIPNVMITTSGATIASLNLIIKHLRKMKGDWASKIIFASSYPETNTGDGIAEILSFLLSKNLNANPQQIQRILAGNLLAMLPLRPPYLQYKESKASLIAQLKLGRSTVAELSRISQVLAAKQIQGIISVDHTLTEKGGGVNLEQVVVTVKDPASKTATSFGLILKKDGTTILSGWDKETEQQMKKRDADSFSEITIKKAEKRAILLKTPAQLSKLNLILLDILGIKNSHEVISALQYSVERTHQQPGSIFMCEKDMKKLELEENDWVLALETKTGQWWPSKVGIRRDCPSRKILISNQDAILMRLGEESGVDLVKYSGLIYDIQDAVFAFDAPGNLSESEVISYVYLHEREIKEVLARHLHGRGNKLWFDTKNIPIYFTLQKTDPTLEMGQLGKVEPKNIEFTPLQYTSNLNTIVCIVLDEGMNIRDIPLKTVYSVRKGFSRLTKLVPELMDFLNGLGEQISRAELACLISLQIIQSLIDNQSDGKFGLCIVTDSVNKFSIQRGEIIQNYVSFSHDMQSEEVLTALIYTVLDAYKEPLGEDNFSLAFRSIAEMMEDIGDERPTLVEMIGNGIDLGDKEPIPYLHAISKTQKYHIDYIGIGEDFDPKKIEDYLKNLSASITPISRFSLHTFAGHLASTIYDLVNRR
ncbi:MAG: hypothetical protein BAJATHORv1_10125 [Candidatus Thorarchaeota archaeon]|nr:MAG: hypothetical protein BAJATHORv1_10125 [Candidatus Thorarchaeota archaeon]